MLTTSLRVLKSGRVTKETILYTFSKTLQYWQSGKSKLALRLGRYECNSGAKFPYRPGDHDNSSRASVFTDVGNRTGLGLFAAQPKESGPILCPTSLNSSFARIISSRSRNMR